MKRPTTEDFYSTHKKISRHRAYFMERFSIDSAILYSFGGANSKVFKYITSSLLEGRSINVFMDYITEGDEHKNEVHRIIGISLEDEISLSVEDPEEGIIEQKKFKTNVRQLALTRHVLEEQTFIRFCSQLKAHLEQKIKEIDKLSGIFFTGVSTTAANESLSNLFSCFSITDKSIFGDKVLKIRNCVLDFDIGLNSPIRKEIGCDQDYFKYKNFPSLKNMLIFQLCCFLNIQTFADFLFYVHGNLEDEFIVSLKTPLKDTPLCSPMSSICHFSKIFSFLNGFNDPYFFFSGSKGLHIYIDGLMLANECCIYSDLDIIFNPKNAKAFRSIVGSYFSWIIWSFYLLESKAQLSPEFAKIIKSVTERIEDITNFCFKIGFDFGTIRQNIVNTKLILTNNITTKASIGESCAKIIHVLHGQEYFTNFSRETIKPFNGNVYDFIETFVSNNTMEKVISTDALKWLSLLKPVQQGIVKKFFCAFLLLNPLLVGDDAVHKLNQKLRMPYTYNEKSGMCSFKIDLFENEPSSLDRNLKVEAQLYENWEKGKIFFSD